MAFFGGQRVIPIWDINSQKFTYLNSNKALSEISTSQLIWDMNGIIKNRPDPFTIPDDSNPDIHFDSGLIWGEDIIDLILVNRGKVVSPLRNLQGFSELDVALTFTDEAVIGIDWSDTVESSHTDFSIDIVKLLHLLHERGQTDIMIYSLFGDYPYIPAGTASNLNISLVYLMDSNKSPSWAKGVLIFE